MLNRYSKLTILLLFLVIVTASVTAQQTKKGPQAIIKKVVQEVDSRKENTNNWKQAKPGEALYTGDEVKTGKKSLAVVQFTDKSTVMLRENSIAKIFADKNDKKLVKNTVLDKGQLYFEVTKQKGDEFRFTTPTMVASIRGTRGLIEVEPDGNSLLMVEEGLVEVTSQAGDKKPENVGAGKLAKINRDGEIQVADQTKEQMKKVKKARSSKVKKIVITAPDGRKAIIEYLESTDKM